MRAHHLGRLDERHIGAQLGALRAAASGGGGPSLPPLI
jgi:hypothetical protein